jgi:hypothetical protein
VRLRALTIALGILIGGVALTPAAGSQPLGSAAGSHPLASGTAGNDDPRFQGETSALGRALRKRMKGVSWHRDCPVGLGKLRLLEVSHWGFDRDAHRGELVVHERVAKRIVRVMRSLFERDFPIRRMKLIDAYAGDDHRSMDADNTSGFNCRFVAGSAGTWSQHAYGRAIDVNPIENPYVTPSGHVSPPAGKPLRRSLPRRQGHDPPG